MEKVKHRPTLFQHGDYHCGNMIVNSGRIGIIDFDKNSAADPYDEFKCFCWNVYANRHFEKGIIDGYFEGRPPKEFLKYWLCTEPNLCRGILPGQCLSGNMK